MKTFLAILATWVVCMAIGASNAYAWGTTYQTYGNLTYGSDGSRYQTYGNTTYATFPNRVHQGGLDANIILDGARNQPDFANTILQGQAIAAQREQENRIAEQEARIMELQAQENIREKSQLKQEQLLAVAKGMTKQQWVCHNREALTPVMLNDGVPQESIDAFYADGCK
jgi:hypothetical protein